MDVSNVAATEGTSTGSQVQTETEVLQLHGADHPGMVLVSAPLTGKNYLNWSHAIKRALRAKMKLGFIDGTLVKPDVNDASFEKWIRVDSMVTTWILNSISKDIVEGFMYTKSSRTLWLDLEERYGTCNGPLLYQLQREITTLSQGNMSVVDYYTKLRKLWDELEVLIPTPQCTCNKCTCVNRAYSMVQSVEKQRQVHMELTDSGENIAMQVRAGARKEVNFRNNQYKRNIIDKKQQFCTHCERSGHTKDNVLKFMVRRTGIKTWLNKNAEIMEIKGGISQLVLRIKKANHQFRGDRKEMLLQELVNLMRGTTPIEAEPQQQVNFAQFDDFAEVLGPSCLNKSQVPYTIDKFLRMIQTQFQAIVKVVRTDNGTEFVNSQCRTLFTSFGILHQTSCSYTPQQNGVVERKHKKLLEVARALLFQSNLPKKFWGESVLTATYLINRLPSSLLNWKSPFEVLYQKPPTYDHLKVFGCLCFASNVTPHKHKFTQRAYKCVFLGYSQLKKAYRVYDLDSNTLLDSRDVIFHETVFPFQSIPLNTDSPSLPLSVPDIDPPAEYTSVAPPSPHISSPSSDTSVPVPTSAPVSPAPRRSLRHTSKPAWLCDYVCSCAESSITCTPDTYSPAHMSFVAQLSSVQEPKTYLQASSDPHWIKAMDQELQALETNGTWELTSLPLHKKPIGSRWVFKLKYNPDGSIERYKARLVAKGYNQIEVATSRSWPLLQLDVNNAFLHGHLDEEVYMDPPEGYAKAQPGQVCRLRRSLYGLKQASRQWNLELTSKLLDFGFVQSPHDNCLFLKGSGADFIALLVYVDDIILTGASECQLTAVKDYLDRLFTIKDLGPAKYFLGLELTRSTHGLHVSQRKYLQDILLDASMTEAKPASTPFPPGLRLTLEGGSLLPSPDRYRRLVGRLLYLGFTRPDISFPVQQLSQFLQSPRTTHWDAALHILRYLRGSSSLGLFFSSRSSLQLSAFSDAAWASCLDSRRSITGFCIFLGSSIVSWKTKKQATVSRSSAEAEYRSMASTVSELLWISYLLRDFQLPVQRPIPFWCDNRAALHITANPVFHERTKHLDIDCHLVRDQFKAGFISPSHISGLQQPADLFTKAVPLPSFTRLLSKLGLGLQAPA
ncbi:UNVERIFIED_CONTAM: Retrovirus-related Pol polyprotein from transposon RE1 [Sesamum radiatum]|uniref:Retrovirus-related Pol polyprotein from transposon RE1 n=1 Tax=Sesamum radiatum TaxID=300843 RepID=A0AAW2T2T5_SESRA